MVDHMNTTLDPKVVASLLALHRFWLKRQTLTGPSRIEAILEHAAATVPFYRDARADPKGGIGAFPLIRKGDVTPNPLRFVSDMVAPEELEIGLTSGTSGTPLKIYRSPLDYYSTFIAIHGVVADRLGPMPDGMRRRAYAVLQVSDNLRRVDAAGPNPSLGMAWTRRIALEEGCRKSHDVFMQCLAMGVGSLYGKPRSLLYMAQLLDPWPDSTMPRPFQILCSGDNLYPDTRKRIETIFGVPVTNLYGLQETGLVAVESEPEGGLLVLSQRAFVEVRDPESGVISLNGYGELVLSNLDNWAMPLIRYATGDHGELETRSGADCAVQVIRNLSGRDSPYFIFNGVRKNPALMNHIFEAARLPQFQLIQDGPRHITVRVASLNGLPGNLSNFITEHARTAFNADVTVEMEVDPELGAFGRKVQRFVFRPDPKRDDFGPGTGPAAAES